MKKKLIVIKRSSLLIMLLILGSCSQDDWEPLNEIVEEEQEEEEVVEYDWAATAEQMQDDTYTVYLSSDGVFKESPSNDRFHYWWNSHALDVLVDGYVRTGDQSYVPKMKALVEGIELHNGGSYQNVFVDDMEWLGIASLRAYEATNDEQFKEVAVFVWEEIKKAWSDEFGGGLLWKMDEPFGKNACSNGPGAILAMRLYEIDQNSEDLEWAQDIYEWEKATLVDSSNGLVWDNISLQDGEAVINKDWIFTYNVGTYLGAGLELYEATGDQVYLNDAVKSAMSVINTGELTDSGVLKSEGQGDGGLFKGILVRYLTILVQNPDLEEEVRNELTDFLELNAITVIEQGLTESPKLVGPTWSQIPEEPTDLSTQLSGVMLMEAVALLEKEGLL